MTDRSTYRADIDGLRALAVGVVVAYHAFPAAVPGGFVGVDVFFVISGYLISGIILTALDGGRFSFAAFYARRIRRIFPALSVVLATVAAAGWFLLYADDYARLGRHIAAGAGFISNFVLWGEASYFDTAADLKPLLHLWSLAIEEQFYLVWPMLLVLASRRRRGALALTLAIGAASFLVAIWQVRLDRTPAFFAPWTRFWELLAGALLACVEIDRELKAVLDRLAADRRRANAIAWSGAAMIVAGVVLIDGTRVFPGLWVLLPVGGTVLLLVSGQRAWLNRRLLSFPAVVWIGLISYPLYLWHWPLLVFARIAEGGTPSVAMRLFMMACSVVLAWGTYRLIERPIRFGAPRRTIVPGLVTAMTLLLAAGVAAHASGGFIERPINRSDAARLVDYYERMRRTGLREAYRAECDFMDWATEDARDAIDTSCTTAGRDATVVLWGDSFAQALSAGIREQLPSTASLAQVATSGCAAAIENFDLTVRNRRCEKANLYAMDSIKRLRPALVIVAQAGGHLATDWPKLVARLRELGADRVAIVGPFPAWQSGLPRVYADHHLDDRPDYVSKGVVADLFDVDRRLAAAVAGVPHATYVSLLGSLCRDGACLARVPGEDPLDLMALDAGHLTPKGSSFVGGAIMKPLLDSAGVR